MAERPKGNIIYEILIVILVAGLLAAILYPSRVWKTEATNENVCHARMDALYQMEVNFRLSEANAYTDSVAMLRDYILSTPSAIMAMDSLVMWEELVTGEQLETMVMGLDMPNDLRQLIAKQLGDRKPLRNLGQWDDLTVKLVQALNDKLANANDSTLNAMISTINWRLVLTEDHFYDMISSQNVPNRIKSRAAKAIQRQNKKIYEVRGWDRYYKQDFIDAMSAVLAEALRDDIWYKVDEDAWEVARRAEWEAEMDLMTEADRDSLWQAEKRRFWDDEKEIHWMKVRGKLWKTEKPVWVVQNEELWKRIIMQRWSAERKASYLKEVKVTLSDSLQQQFTTIRDSLWRASMDSLEAVEYPVWFEKNKKDLEEEVIEGLWESARRVSWDEKAYQEWMDSENASETFWAGTKERLWRRNRPAFWFVEEAKQASRKMARYQLDIGVAWMDALGEDVINAIVEELQLPDNEMLWKKIVKSKRDNGTKLFGLGVQDLFKYQLIDSVFTCPVAHLPYHIEAVDTSAIKYLNIFCPIEERDNGAVGLSIDRLTGDTTEVDIPLSSKVKLFGGGSVKNHGSIRDEKKSWEKQ